LLLHAARRLAESIEPERIYERFHELVRDVIQHDGLIVSSYDDRDELIRCEYAWTDGAVIDPTTLPALPLNREGGGMQSRVIVSGEPDLFNDVRERVKNVDGVYYNVDAEGHVEKIPDGGPAGTAAAMMVPVKDEGRVVGVVQVMTDTGQYTDDDLELFDGLVTQMGAAVRNARLQQERRRLEAAEAAARAVAAEREQAAQVLEAVGDGIFLLDGDGVVRLWNRAATLATGLPAAAVLDRRLGDVIANWDTLAAAIPLAAEGAAARAVTLPVEIEGRDLWLSFVAVRLADGVVYAFRDVTRERLLEEERSDFIATISHELRTPMTGVYGAAQTLLREDIELEPEQRQTLLSMIATEAARLSQITEEVLLASQLDRGELHFERAAVDVGEVVRAAVNSMRSQLHDSTPIEVDVADHVVASGDSDRIQQVLVNLLDNAAKYGGAPVRISAESTNGLVRIAVSDAGPGISPADRDRIFEKFYRADTERSRAARGTGLGLYISRELAQRMGGRLALASAPGEGARFVVELPRPEHT
ncbi:MAG TPA: GAF domain-containing sensor histidine kinase, partial [Gaiellaceae bacterium]|nr:GAF domain-containing sensor histidine kinase [Gaiellaceae bacterium]